MINTTQVCQLKGLQMCSDLCRVVNFIVAYDLFPLTSGSDWVLIGATTRDPLNHYGTLTTLSGIRAVASQYHSEFPDYPVIAINDLSLPLGGIFDLNGNWAGPHYNHSRGKAVDIRGNGRPNSVQQIPAVQARFLEICEGNGAIVTLHESQGTLNEHFHCEWPWGSLIEQTIPVMQVEFNSQNVVTNGPKFDAKAPRMEIVEDFHQGIGRMVDAGQLSGSSPAVRQALQVLEQCLETPGETGNGSSAACGFDSAFDAQPE